MRIKYFCHRRNEDIEEFWHEVSEFVADKKVDIKFQADKNLIELLIIHED